MNLQAALHMSRLFSIGPSGNGVFLQSCIRQVLYAEKDKDDGRGMLGLCENIVILKEACHK